MRKIIFISLYKYPDVDAGAFRNQNLAICFEKNGFESKFFGICNKKNDAEKYISIYSNRNAFTSLFSNVFLSRRIISNLKRIVGKEDLVCITNFFSKRIILKILNLSKIIGFKVIFSIVERYNKPKRSKILSIVLNRNYRNCESFYKNATIYNRPIISISKYIFNFFSNKGLTCFYVPFIIFPQIDRETLFCSKKNDNAIKIIYAGNPGNKDLLLNIFEGLKELPFDKQQQFVFNFYGFSKPERLNFDFESIKAKIFFHPYLDKHDIEDAYLNSDFSILIRNQDSISSIAGFPTKIAESLYYGIPPIVNFTGDLSLYLIDNVNCVEVKGSDKNSIKNAFERILEMNEEDFQNLRKKTLFSFNTTLNASEYMLNFKKIIEFVGD